MWNVYPSVTHTQACHLFWSCSGDCCDDDDDDDDDDDYDDDEDDDDDDHDDDDDGDNDDGNGNVHFHFLTIIAGSSISHKCWRQTGRDLMMRF